MNKFLKVDIDKIKSLRISNGLSIEKMSTLLGYESPNGYYYLETGRNNFSAEKLAMVAGIFGLKIDELFFEKKVAKMANNTETA
ncbi:helix-turn-helix domain-containing protein [Schinkia azotoformans]|uniref:helix-turn-helix domain-containing protein n=1 Tax=Schinkia azotoformans TaxID=1454 RepID=UPI002DBCB98A|nr:helix-turn-helix transcriptional regulator [Schinkia azotoformans]MEC1716661.1 helix-turn-helix transcriptional regulator [Schinkia azotoformans]MEC1739500.1 helix-turn-helix transcriptional regulator [Schinkia azotoformans]MEC1745430.1 helix-turn-helix transcriptional regulator [Schinkia azotoformans]MEC1756493.1 helix-turn-helix transcriptional regulator [Schinkia azotoformans]MEC1765760.1 helix-turn-helix transcriptional regulator [Schinkia azotoformans]